MSKENLKYWSVAGYALMVLALVPLVYTHALFSASPVVIVVQVLAVLLMVWARMTFGSRSFHYAADATKGGLVTTGPYNYLRHPIYAAVAYFAVAGIVANWSWMNASLFSFLCIGIAIRIYCEEKLVTQEYPQYSEYAGRTKRIIPFVF